MVQEKCQQLGVLLLLEESEGIEFQNTGIICNGYFVDQPIPKLGVAIKKKLQDWFLVLIHEYSHLEQWAENSPTWTNNKIGHQDASDLLDLWLNHEVDLDQDTLDKIFQINIELESDCEKRAIQNIIKFNLEVNIEEYIQKANAYVLFYHVMKKYRRWYQIGKEPYSLPEIWSKMPTQMNLDYNQISDELMTILEYSLK